MEKSYPAVVPHGKIYVKFNLDSSEFVSTGLFSDMLDRKIVLNQDGIFTYTIKKDKTEVFDPLRSIGINDWGKIDKSLQDRIWNISILSKDIHESSKDICEDLSKYYQKQMKIDEEINLHLASAYTLFFHMWILQMFLNKGISMKNQYFRTLQCLLSTCLDYSGKPKKIFPSALEYLSEQLKALFAMKKWEKCADEISKANDNESKQSLIQEQDKHLKTWETFTDRYHIRMSKRFKKLALEDPFSIILNQILRTGIGMEKEDCIFDLCNHRVGVWDDILIYSITKEEHDTITRDVIREKDGFGILLKNKGDVWFKNTVLNTERYKLTDTARILSINVNDEPELESWYCNAAVDEIHERAIDAYNERYGLEEADRDDDYLQFDDEYMKKEDEDIAKVLIHEKAVEGESEVFTKKEVETLEGDIDGVTFFAPKRGIDLKIAGTKMVNCVGSYIDKVNRKESLIIIMERKTKYVGCIELHYNGSNYKVIQVKGEKNHKLDPEEEIVYQKWLQKNNIEDITRKE